MRRVKNTVYLFYDTTFFNRVNYNGTMVGKRRILFLAMVAVVLSGCVDSVSTENAVCEAVKDHVEVEHQQPFRDCLCAGEAAEDTIPAGFPSDAENPTYVFWESTGTPIVQSVLAYQEPNSTTWKFSSITNVPDDEERHDEYARLANGCSVEDISP